MKLSSWLSTVALCASTVAVAAISTPAIANSLDGKRFDGVFMERGKTSGDADTITFKDGRFRSSACDKYGYSDATYKTTAQGDAVVFEAETESARYGKLVWKDFVRGDKLDATVTAIRSGKAPVENWVVAGEKK